MAKYTSTVPQSRGRAADRVSHSGMRRIVCKQLDDAPEYEVEIVQWDSAIRIPAMQYTDDDGPRFSAEDRAKASYSEPECAAPSTGKGSHVPEAAPSESIQRFHDTPPVVMRQAFQVLAGLVRVADRHSPRRART